MSEVEKKVSIMFNYSKTRLSFQIHKCLNLDNQILIFSHKLMGCISKIFATPHYPSTAKEKLCVCSS